MKAIITFLFLFLFFGVDSKALTDAKTVAERYLLKGNTAVRISVETGWKRDDRVPVQLDIQGLSLTLWMDGEGRVFNDSLRRYEKEKGKRARRQELFRIDRTSGQIQRGSHTLNGRIYEQNPLRTRLRFDNLLLALELDIQRDRATLDLNGIVIPARLHLEEESGGVRELVIGERENQGQGNLLLDAQRGQLLWQDHFRLALPQKEKNRACWAEKQKKEK